MMRWTCITRLENITRVSALLDVAPLDLLIDCFDIELLEHFREFFCKVAVSPQVHRISIYSSFSRLWWDAIKVVFQNPCIRNAILQAPYNRRACPEETVKREICNLSYIRNLTLRNFSFSSSFMELLKHKSLVTLNAKLAFCPKSCVLSEFLRSNTTLRELWLGGSLFDLEKDKDLAKALVENTTLVRTDIFDQTNEIRQKVLRRNRRIYDNFQRTLRYLLWLGPRSIIGKDPMRIIIDYLWQTRRELIWVISALVAESSRKKRKVN